MTHSFCLDTIIFSPLFYSPAVLFLSHLLGVTYPHPTMTLSSPTFPSLRYCISPPQICYGEILVSKSFKNNPNGAEICMTFCKATLLCIMQHCSPFFIVLSMFHDAFYYLLFHVFLPFIFPLSSPSLAGALCIIRSGYLALIIDWPL